MVQNASSSKSSVSGRRINSFSDFLRFSIQATSNFSTKKQIFDNCMKIKIQKNYVEVLCYIANERWFSFSVRIF